MNEHEESETTTPPVFSAPVSPSTHAERAQPKPFSYWAKRFLICNPFYLVSAALLLFGMYRLSVDRNFFAGEISQLVFNLSSLQFYELLLVATAIFLATRRIWYDSTLLVALENLFVFVPFILISQVALINTRIVWLVCALTAIIAIARFGGLKRYFRELNLPPGLLVIGAALLVINIWLLATYRNLGETKMGWQPDSGREFEINQFTWLVILPAALALANFLPHARETGSLEPQRRWLPAGFFTLWMAATGAHLYCLNYVYNFAFRVEMLAPALWALAWTAYRCAPEILAWGRRAPQYALGVTALLAPLVAANESQYGGKIFFALAVLNTAIYAALYFRKEDRHFARHLLFASVVMLVCGLPDTWIDFLTPTLERRHYIFAGIAVYLMLYMGLSRNPRIGIFGAVTLMLGIAVLFQDYNGAFHWALQTGVIFLLLHSLRWDDDQNARAIRNTAAGLWVTHAFIWTTVGGEMWMPCATASIVLGISFVVRLLRGRWDLIILPIASTLTVLSGPGHALITLLRSAPMGLLAVVGSFLLFALGTAAALTKHRWHRTSI